MGLEGAGAAARERRVRARDQGKPMPPRTMLARGRAAVRAAATTTATRTARSRIDAVRSAGTQGGETEAWLAAAGRTDAAARVDIRVCCSLPSCCSYVFLRSLVSSPRLSPGLSSVFPPPCLRSFARCLFLLPVPVLFALLVVPYIRIHTVHIVPHTSLPEFCHSTCPYLPLPAAPLPPVPSTLCIRRRRVCNICWMQLMHVCLSLPLPRGPRIVRRLGQRDRASFRAILLSPLARSRMPRAPHRGSIALRIRSPSSTSNSNHPRFIFLDLDASLRCRPLASSVDVLVIPRTLDTAARRCDVPSHAPRACGVGYRESTSSALLAHSAHISYYASLGRLGSPAVFTIQYLSTSQSPRPWHSQSP